MFASFVILLENSLAKKRIRAGFDKLRHQELFELLGKLDLFGKDTRIIQN